MGWRLLRNVCANVDMCVCVCACLSVVWREYTGAGARWLVRAHELRQPIWMRGDCVIYWNADTKNRNMQIGNNSTIGVGIRDTRSDARESVCVFARVHGGAPSVWDGWHTCRSSCTARLYLGAPIAHPSHSCVNRQSGRRAAPNPPTASE